MLPSAPMQEAGASPGWQCRCCGGKRPSRAGRSSNLRKDRQNKEVQLSVGSLMPVLVTSKWKHAGWLLRINRLLRSDRIVEDSDAA